MKPTWLKILLSAIGLFVAMQSYAQVCTGSLGDPVIKEDFGSGTGAGSPLGQGITTMSFTSDNCPNDGSYTIAHSITGAGNCHPESWHDVPTDHSGDPNGYMMIVNASNEPSVFFTQAANGLCPNTKYEFSAYILNLITAAASGPGVNEPDITFSIEAQDGTPLATGTTGPIDASSGIVWNFYPIYFTTPANVTNVVVKMTNKAPGGNGNDLILDDITFRACGPIIQSGFGAASGQLTQNFCEGSSAAFTLKAQVIGDNPVKQWQENNNGSGWQDIPNATGDTYTRPPFIAAKGIYQYRLGVANGSDITSVGCRVYSTPLTVTVNPLPVVAAIPPKTFCEGYPLTLEATGGAGATYRWTGPGIQPTSQNPLVINSAAPANEGTYTVIVTSDKGCDAAPVNVPVKIVPKVVASVSADVPICAGDHTQLQASGGLYYKWTPSTGLDHDDIANPVASPTETTTYSINVSNDGCNDDSKSIKVTVIANPVANGGGNKKIFEGQSVKLNGTVSGDEISSISWSPVAALDDPTSATPIASPTDDITYTMTVTSKSCGISTSTVFVRVYQKVTVPNTFSPNADGINDTWNIEALITYPESSVMVFNRYGKVVYQSMGYSKAWDGTYNGTAVPEGVYYYIIDLKNGTQKLSGWVLIVK